MKIRTLLSKALRKAAGPGLSHPAKAPAACQNCGFDMALFLGTEVSPDFDTTAELPPGLRAAFMDRQDGICLRCGVYQAYKRFSEEQLRTINYLGKDISTSDPVFHKYPVPAETLAAYNENFFADRIRQWREYFRKAGIRPMDSLFIRPLFGGSVKFIRDEFGAKVAGIDMSDLCLRTVKEWIPEFTAYQGAINGMLEGDFLASGPYDSVFVVHTLTHAGDVHKMLEQIRSLLKEGGFAVFSDEIVRKPRNPFHMLHMSEVQLEAILLKHFRKVDRIDACYKSPPDYIRNYTLKNDGPDLVAWK